MQDTYDPFSFLLAEIRAYDAGQRHWTPHLRQHYLDELLVDEAEEIAWGRRHLTIVHGSSYSDAGDPLLEQLVRGIVQHIPPATWSRVGSVAGHHVTITLDGPHADAFIDLMADVARQTNPGTWRILATPVAVPLA